MDIGGPKSRGSGSQESNEPVPPGITNEEFQKVAASKLAVQPSTPSPTFSTKPTAKGVENAKKRLRAFSIQKKTPLPSIPVPKAVTAGNTTVLIGKLSSNKVTPKPEKVDDEQKKIPRPPKPGGSRKNYMESYSALQKRTLNEIEDMKRKMELVDLGIPLGLICPSTNEKAMPTKAMPPIKTFLDSAKVDEIIREAKKCRAEGREFKFDYQKLLPDYDNPFQRTKRDEQLQQVMQLQEQQQDQQQQPQTPIKFKLEEIKQDIEERTKARKDETDKRRSDKYDKKYSYRREDRYKEKDRSRERDRTRDADEKNKRGKIKDKEENLRTDAKETKVDLSDYLVCDSWSLDEKNSSPHVDEILDIANIPMPKDVKAKEQTDNLKEITSVKDVMDSPKERLIKIEKLQPVMDSFEFEIDPNEEDEALEIIDEQSSSKPTKLPKSDSPFFDSKMVKDKDDMNDDMFLESVLNEIKQENLSDDENEKGLVEYDMSPDRDNFDCSKSEERSSVTPELDDRVLQSQRSNYSDTRSVDSGIKSTESGYRSQSSRRSDLSAEKELEPDLDDKLASSTVDSLETWSFVLKICQPLLFRHDRNRCFKETRALPKVWHSVSPRVCSCVKGRAVVYEELEMCKSALVDRVYHCEQFPEPPIAKARNWYLPLPYCLVETSPYPAATEWEDIPDTETTDKHNKHSRTDRGESKSDRRVRKADRTDSKTDRTESKSDRTESKSDRPESRGDNKSDRTDGKRSKSKKSQRSSLTPEVSLDIEYQRFMEAVCFDVTESNTCEESEAKQEARSTTPVRQEPKKKKKKKDREAEKMAKGDAMEKKKMKSNELKSSEGWSQESMDDEEEKRQENKRKKKMEADEAEKRAAAEAAKKRKMCSDNWSQESDLGEPEVERSKKERHKVKEKTRKRKHSTSTISSDSDSEDLKKKKKALKKKALKSTKSKSAKRRQLGKKILRRLKEKKRKKEKESEPEEEEKETKKKERKLKKKKQFKPKKKEKKKKKAKASSSSSSSSSSGSSSESESESEKRVKKKKDESMKKKKNKKKKRRSSTSSTTSHSEDLFDVNVLMNIKTEPHLDDEPQRSHREIISVQQLQDDFSSNVKIKQEVEDAKPESEAQVMDTFESNAQNETPVVTPPEVEEVEPQNLQEVQPLNFQEAEPPKLDDTHHSQSSQESVVSVKEPLYEKDESHLRPPSHNSECSFRDAVARETDQYKSTESNQYKTTEEDKYPAYEESYEMYEHLAMAYQSDVASKQQALDTANEGEQRIETVVRTRACGEIKCDWRRTDPPAQPAHNRPSRWGLKPGEVNIVLTGGSDTSTNEQYPIESISEPVYKIQSLANRNDTAQSSCYDEAYMDMYGAMDRLQYGDCFAPPAPSPLARAPRAAPAAAGASANTVVPVRNTLDDRIDRALRETVLGEVAKDMSEGDKDSSDRGILVTTSLAGAGAGRGAKRVRFADGYKPGQDSDTEQPPLNKRKKPKRVGCAWPCPATHVDHVPLWDALPPPPPPPGSPPPPPPAAPPPLHLLRAPRLPTNSAGAGAATLTALPYPMHKFDASTPIPNFMPPEPPPGLINFT